MRYIYLILVMLIFILSGCEDYLDKKDESVDLLTEEQILSDKEKLKTVAYRLYDALSQCTFETRYYWDKNNSRAGAGGTKNYANIMQLSGECISTRSNIPIYHTHIRGNWEKAVREAFANPDFYDMWDCSWEMIYVSNYLQDALKRKADIVDPRLTEDEINQFIGETFLFRALAYHEINKRWGAMPYFKEPMLADKDYNLPRPTLAEQIEDIVQDIDSAIFYLPVVSYLDDPVNMGRVGKAAAMALKSRALTTAASPNYVEGNGSNQSLWERAAKAAWDVIKLSQTEAKIGLYTGDYNEIFHSNPGTVEGLWPRYYEPEQPQVYWQTWMWNNLHGGLGFSPTLEVVDRFETVDGWPVNHPSSGYSDQDPYVNREPRFYKDILYHGSIWSKTAENQTIDMLTQDATGKAKLGKDRSNPEGTDYGNSKTGFLVRKMIADKWNKKKYNTRKYANPPYIRMAEMYLNYAEAVNEAYNDPNAKVPGASLSAVGALNAIRDRVGHVPVRSEFTSDAGLFRERVRNEFYVELCFEYHIWFDQLRWRTAHEYDQYNFTGVKIIEDPAATNEMGVRFERFEVPIERHFEEKHYRYPLRLGDLQLHDNLVQNPGW